jgi:riboflavin synthase
MFTGIIEELGTVESLTPGADPARLVIRSPRVLEGISLGDSIAVSGCCLTVTSHDGQTWSADVIATTLAATALGDLRPGDVVNLERCVRADSRLDGHIVQGHVDGTGEILSRKEQAGTTLLRLRLPEGLARYVVAKGSLAVDGVSLTVAEIDGDEVTIGLIPETLERTTLGRREVGQSVNLEVDVLAKYVEKLTAGLVPAAAGTEQGR